VHSRHVVATRRHRESHALDENIEAIKAWQRASVHHRSRVEHLSEEITRIIARGNLPLALRVGQSEPDDAGSHKRANLDLQINLLAEREMTAVLRLLQDIAHHLDVKVSLTADQVNDLVKKTDVESLADRMEELADDSRRPQAARRKAMR
jgi:uncharacterized membrane protein